MPEQNDDKLLDHSYDGIQEYDNPLPRWWVWIFWATVIWAPIYYFLPVPFGEGPGKVALYEADVAKAVAAQPAPTGTGVTDDQLTQLVTNAAALADGKTVWNTNCAACHRADGGGLIGPNLTDDAWIHGGMPSQVHNTISVGVLAKGMPPWERILKPEQLNNVTAYVLSLKGSNPPDAKAPEGPAPTAPATAAPTSGM
jgi:cytochrome c oxidase cbb3-type subunit III